MPCYGEVVLDDEGNEMDLVGILRQPGIVGSQPCTALGGCWLAGGR